MLEEEKRNAEEIIKQTNPNSFLEFETERINKHSLKIKSEDCQFLKIVDKFEYAEELLKEGKIFMNPISSYSNINENAKNDFSEGCAVIIGEKVNLIIEHPQDLHIEKNGKEIINKELNKNNAKYRGLYIPELKNSPVYCIYTIKNQNITSKLNKTGFKLNKINKNILEFGNYGVLILDTKEFMRRVIKKINELNLKYYSSFVDYIDYSEIEYLYKKSVFEKPKNYSYQNEFRIFIPKINNKKEPLIFEIGSIEDIAKIVLLRKR